MAVPSGTLTLTANHGTTYIPTLWVNGTTGSDSNTKAQVAAGAGAVQWATIGRAAWGSTDRAAPDTDEAAAAGDVVSIAAGTYSTSVNNADAEDGDKIIYNPANEGTSGNPIVFLAYGVVTLCAPNANNGIIGSNGKDYIIWYADRSQGHSWVVNATTYTADPDEVYIPFGNGTWGPTGILGSNYCTIEGLVVDGGPSTGGDNYSGVALRNAVSPTIRNCTITSFKGATNCSGTTLYGNTDTLIEHNEISDCQHGVYLKGQAPTLHPYQSGTIVRYNYIHDCATQGIRASYEAAWGGDSRIYQNLIVNCADGIKWIQPNSNPGPPHHDWAYNNTFYNLSPGEGATHGGGTGDGGRFWNNIVHTATFCIIPGYGATMPGADVYNCEHNCYYNYSDFYEGSDGAKTLEQFKAAYDDQEQTSPASINSDPLFVNAAGGNFRLQTTPVPSPARDLGRHPQTGATIDAGCYLTGAEVIGVET